MTRAEIEDWDEDVLIAIYADDRMTRAQLDAGLAALTRLRDAAFEVERLRGAILALAEELEQAHATGFRLDNVVGRNIARRLRDSLEPR